MASASIATLSSEYRAVGLGFVGGAEAVSERPRPWKTRQAMFLK